MATPITRRAGAALAAALVLGLFLSTPAQAAWTGTARSDPATMTMARLGHTFTPVGSGALDDMMSGTGGASYTSAPVAAGGSVYVDLINDSTVPTTLSGTVSATLDMPMMDLPDLTIFGCDVDWDTELGQCPTGAVVLAGPYPMDAAPVFVWGVIDAGATVHVAVATDTAPASITVEATVTDRALRPGVDRTGS
jgi:hypothetical protein